MSVYCNKLALHLPETTLKTRRDLVKNGRLAWGYLEYGLLRAAGLLAILCGAA